MIDYDTFEKFKELYKKYEEFDRQWLGTRGVFNIMNKVGIIDEETHREVLEHYDRMMAPINKFENEVKAKIVAKVSKVAWNSVLVDKKEDEE